MSKVSLRGGRARDTHSRECDELAAKIAFAMARCRFAALDRVVPRGLFNVGYGVKQDKVFDECVAALNSWVSGADITHRARRLLDGANLTGFNPKKRDMDFAIAALAEWTLEMRLNAAAHKVHRGSTLARRFPELAGRLRIGLVRISEAQRALLAWAAGEDMTMWKLKTVRTTPVGS